MSFDLKGIFKNAVSGGLAKLGDSAKGIIQAVAEGKLDKMEALAQIEAEKNRHEEELGKQAIDIEKAFLEDKASARTRETEFVKATGHMDWMQTIVGTLVMLAFIGALLLIGFKELPKGSEHLMINAIGIMEGLVLSVVGYYYGSSAGSRIKDQMKK